MKLSPEARAGAVKLVTFYCRALCDDRKNCSHDHRPSAGGPRRNIISDLKMVDDLRRAERNDFGPAVAPAPEPARAEGHDESTPEEQGMRLVWLWRILWRSHASWLGIDDEPRGGYQGEESASTPAGTAPV